MSHHQDHPYHLVNPSPWPILSSLALFLLTLGMAMFMHKHSIGGIVALAGLALMLYCMYGWWSDVVKEAREEKAHTREVTRGLRFGMALFIASEVMFFAAFFWAFFGASTLPKLPLEEVWAVAEGIWPPKGIEPFDPWHLPFLNTLILLLSGTTVTWAHYAILHNQQKQAVQALWYTVILGVIFTLCQAYEYSHAAFGFKDGIYASTFYMATGFHGFHVIVGTIFLAVCLVRAKKGHFVPNQHLGFEFAAWYWHFVDVVWLFLFVFVYVDMANKLMPAFMSIFTGTNMLIFFIASLIGTGFGVWRVIMKGGMSKVAHH
ncbi:MAG: cytochrome c oxidase subunit 3 [Alphaproteobacteria bacterium]